MSRHDGAANVYLPRTDSIDFSATFVATGKQLTIADVPVCPGKTASTRGAPRRPS